MGMQNVQSLENRWWGFFLFQFHSPVMVDFVTPYVTMEKPYFCNETRFTFTYVHAGSLTTFYHWQVLTCIDTFCLFGWALEKIASYSHHRNFRDNLYAEQNPVCEKRLSYSRVQG